MSFHLLLKHYHNGDVDKFRALLSGGTNAHHTSKSFGGGQGSSQSMGALVGSPSGFGTSPRMVNKHRKVSGQSGNNGGLRGPHANTTRADVNGRDHAGLTILHRAVSSTSVNAIAFATVLIEHPAIDLYIQDTENGWTALHRALYFGNITLARAIIERDLQDPTHQAGNSAQRATSSVIKVKDFEGNSPFDVYNATIARRSLEMDEDDGSDQESQDENETFGDSSVASNLLHSIDGDEIFAWGSSRNHGLGFKDQDDRQHPERIVLKRPDHLLFRFYREYLEATQEVLGTPSKHFSFPKSVKELPSLISNRPIVIQDVALSKLHSAILTTDPESNLYMCGFGPGGRLGTGDETTRFSYVPVEGGSISGKKVCKIALGQNHTLAVTADGSLSSWGTNTYGQLGYTLPRPAMKDEEPVCASPRQLFGSLKREIIIGVAASAIHSVAHTSTSLFTWGKNEGQLGLMDSDSRSLEVQASPRKVAASLFKAPIKMVSAINAATIILLANHSLFVFTNYGYNLVKFPLYESFTNYHLKTTALTTRYDSMATHISEITAGGDTIGAISSRGDLYTVTVRMEPAPSSTSTTNPTKIRESLSAPQLVWSLRKGHWDGVKSVGITENGSVIVCTQAGAVWRRIERSQNKNPFSSARNQKEFKFQRVPGLTKVAAVRSTPFGVFTAIRKDCDVTRTQISVDEQNLWKDIGPLLSFKDIEISESPMDTEDDADSGPRFWKPMLPKDLFDPLKRAVLTSPDLEADITRHLLKGRFDGCNIEVSTTTSEVTIPIHSFILARSPVLRRVLHDYHINGSASFQELLNMGSGPASSNNSLFGGVEAIASKPRLIFQSLDLITLINLVNYLYTDGIIDVWHFTRQNPNMAFRYRQIRVELMKVASHLKLAKLESAVRLMTEPEKILDNDMSLAIQDPNFFEDGDTVVELDGGEAIVHSHLLCQRCPFFDGLFNGRAGGQWLAGRKQNGPDLVTIDLKHVQPNTFDLILRYLYTDAGTELFDEVVTDDIDDFSELVLDVMAVADELMLDRLSQICQQIIGRFVSTRNVSGLLNTIAPYSMSRFRDASYEYVCLQLESMLENHLLNDLDDDLSLELDEVVRANQLNCLPYSKSGRAELLLLERNPILAEDIHDERQRRVRDLIFRAHLKEEESKLSSSFRNRAGSLDDTMATSPGGENSKRRQKSLRNAPFSPNLRPKDSTADLMFDMDEEETLSVGSPGSPCLRPKLDVPRVRRKDPSSPNLGSDEEEPQPRVDLEQSSFPTVTPDILNNRPPQTPPSIKTWSSPALGSTKLDMREIMAQTSATRTSTLSMSFSAQMARDEAVRRQAAPKLSQKERKQQQQVLLQHALSQSQSSVEPPESKPSSPWQTAGPRPKVSLKDVLDQPDKSPTIQPAKTLAPPAISKPSTPRRTASPDTRFSGQSRSSSTKGQPSSSSSRPALQSRLSVSSPIVPHSKIYPTNTAKAEPSLLLSMTDIIGQQRREQEVIKEAVAKRSLQEIQEEQAFQEWWNQESRRAQEEEEAAKARAIAAAAAAAKRERNDGSSGGNGRSKESGGRGRGGRPRGGGKAVRGEGGGGGGGSKGKGRGGSNAGVPGGGNNGAPATTTTASAGPREQRREKK